VRQAAHNNISPFGQKGLVDPVVQIRSKDTLQDFITAQGINLPQVNKAFLMMQKLKQSH
jgi:hypothetical protein